ncbi:hypothetical protein GCM10012282_34420 [Streptomyces lacrimifluminis]|uniref:Uncharacterized protein n=1 Tax=Streptomyces lacrimifluminis TaxID=1500077 RepID=A0A917KXF8_9ACTN|nr:hypothetical protein GCM10012282_34420 [Streptomyces lacrimifluminis]
MQQQVEEQEVHQDTAAADGSEFHRFKDDAPHRSDRNGQPVLGDIHTHARDNIRGAPPSRKG